MEVPNVELRSNELDLAVRALVEENILQEYHTEDETEVIEAYLPDGVEVIQVSPEEEGWVELHEEEVISEAHENIDIQNSCLQLSNSENSSDETGGNAVRKDNKPCCYVCGKKFKSLLNLRRHAAVHSEEYPYIHEGCGKKFKWKKSLKAHQKICRLGLLAPGKKRMSSWNVYIRTHACGLPPVQAIHMLKDGWKALSDEEKMSYRMIGRAGMMDGGTCHKCNKYYKTNHRLKEHLKSCGRQFICHVCKKIFTSDSALRVHRVRHTKTFECKVCGKCFGCISKLKSHAVLHDENLKTNICECGKRFSRKHGLDKHMMKCSGEFVPESPDKSAGGYCSKCNKFFPSLNRMREHEKECGLQFPCDICSKIFKSAKTMRAHKKTHSGGFRCEVCEKSFVSSSKLKRHSVMHDQSLKTLECVCGKMFGRTDNFKKHTSKCVKSLTAV